MRRSTKVSPQKSRAATKKPLPIAVALDDSWAESKIWLKRLRGRVWGFKVGSILFTEKGPSIISVIRRMGYSVFLDLKFHDIPHTVQRAVRAAFKAGANVTTVHAAGGKEMLELAAKEQKSNQIIVAVSVLTSLDQVNLSSIGIERPLAEQMSSLSDLALNSGIKGLVSSPLEVATLRQKFPSAFLVTPGIRVGETHDQKRTGSLRQALEDGSSLVVLGRALTESKDWEATWQNLICSLDETSLKKRFV